VAYSTNSMPSIPRGLAGAGRASSIVIRRLLLGLASAWAHWGQDPPSEVRSLRVPLARNCQCC
jgi:hypothetical protein